MADAALKPVEATNAVFDGVAKVGIQATLLLAVVGFMLWQLHSASITAKEDKDFQRGQTKLLAEVVMSCTEAMKTGNTRLEAMENSIDDLKTEIRSK